MQEEGQMEEKRTIRLLTSADMRNYVWVNPNEAPPSNAIKFRIQLYFQSQIQESVICKTIQIFWKENVTC